MTNLSQSLEQLQKNAKALHDDTTQIVRNALHLFAQNTSTTVSGNLKKIEKNIIENSDFLEKRINRRLSKTVKQIKTDQFRNSLSLMAGVAFGITTMALLDWVYPNIYGLQLEKHPSHEWIICSRVEMDKSAGIHHCLPKE